MLRRFEPCLGRNAQVSKWSKEVTNKKKEKEKAVFPSGQRGGTQDAMRKLRGFEPHSSHLIILTAIFIIPERSKG